MPGLHTTLLVVEPSSPRFSMEILLTAIARALTPSQVIQDEADVRELVARRDSLSERERQVMDHVVSGQLNKQVGAALGISEITVKAHRGRVMQKMGARSLAELVVMAMLLRLVPTRAS